MTAELGRSGHPMLATLLTVSLSGLAQALTTCSQAGLVSLPNPNVGSYNLLNLRAGDRFWHDKAEVAVPAFNALNDKHRERPLGETIGSRVMGWLTVRF